MQTKNHHKTLIKYTYNIKDYYKKQYKYTIFRKY